MEAPAPEPVVLVFTRPLFSSTTLGPSKVIQPPLLESLLVILRLPPLIVVLMEAETEIVPPSFAVILPPLMVVLSPASLMEPLVARRFPLEDAAPLLTTSIRPPSLAVREEPLPMLVALEVGVADPLEMTPPTTMRCAKGVEGSGAVAVISVAPLTVVMPWSMSGVALPE